MCVAELMEAVLFYSLSSFFAVKHPAWIDGHILNQNRNYIQHKKKAFGYQLRNEEFGLNKEW